MAVSYLFLEIQEEDERNLLVAIDNFLQQGQTLDSVKSFKLSYSQTAHKYE
jgi:hypothetical protein